MTAERFLIGVLQWFVFLGFFNGIINLMFGPAEGSIGCFLFAFVSYYILKNKKNNYERSRG